MNKHRHKWELIYTDAGTLGEGLLYICKNCSSCLEFDSKKPNMKQVHKVYRDEIKRLKSL